MTEPPLGSLSELAATTALSLLIATAFLLSVVSIAACGGRGEHAGAAPDAVRVWHLRAQLAETHPTSTGESAEQHTTGPIRTDRHALAATEELPRACAPGIRPIVPVSEPPRRPSSPAHRAACAQYLAERRERTLAAETPPYLGRHRLNEPDGPTSAELTTHLPGIPLVLTSAATHGQVTQR